VTESKRTLKQRALRGMLEYLWIAFYLMVVFSLFAIYRSIVLAQYRIDFEPQGLALINALALSKVILVGQELHLADQFRDAPLIYPTLIKSFVFAIILACFKIAEEVVMAMFHGKSWHESIALIAAGSLQVDLSLTVLMFVILIPFFGFTELRRVFGRDRLAGAFFRPRSELNLPSAES
jgi:glucose-6-phosphate-specific signal transduction histidine kinase